MKTFFGEYGLATILAVCALLLVCMATPIGKTIAENLKNTSDSLGENSEHMSILHDKADKSMKELAGEDMTEEDCIYIGYNPTTRTVYMANNPNTEGISSCSVKSEKLAGSDVYSFMWNGTGTISIAQNVTKIVIESTIKPTTMSRWFYSCINLSKIEGLNKINTSRVENMSLLFNGCRSLKSLNLSSWDVSNVTNMSTMFYGCKKLSSLNIDGWNTAKVTSMSSMFSECNNLTSLNLSSFNTSKVTSFTRMFQSCTKLTTITYGNNFTKRTGYVSADYMYDNCPANQVDWY